MLIADYIRALRSAWLFSYCFRKGGLLCSEQSAYPHWISSALEMRTYFKAAEGGERGPMV